MAEPPGYKIRFTGAFGAIAFKEKHWTVFRQQILPQARAQLQVTMQAWANRGPRDIPPTKFRFEGHYENAGKSVRVEAFKTRHVRFYGAAHGASGKPLFLVTGVDVAKKQDKADPDLLEAAGKAAHRLVHTK